MQKCRKADFIALCGLTSLVRICFALYAQWTKKEVILRKRSAQLRERVVDGRQRRRLRCWVLCSRSCAQEENMRNLVPLRELLPDLPSQLGGALEVDNVVRVRGILFALWAEVACSMRPFRQASLAVRMRARARCRSRGLHAWRQWLQLRKQRDVTVRSHCNRWSASTLLPCILAWRRVVRHSNAAAAMRSAGDLSILRAIWRSWLSLADRSKKFCRSSAAFRHMQLSQEKREILRSWALRASRDARIRRFVCALDAAQTRWATREVWCHEASSDPRLQEMFCRFASAFDTQSRFVRPVLHQDSELRAVLSLVWSRQQLSVAFARMRGSYQGWVLDMWPLGNAVLLPPDSERYVQAKKRLPLMLKRLEEESSPAYATSIVRAARQSTGQPVETRSMWFALADLLVVHHPGWQSRSPPQVEQLAQHHTPMRSSVQAPFVARPLLGATPQFGGCRDGQRPELRIRLPVQHNPGQQLPQWPTTGHTFSQWPTSEHAVVAS
jgi:hypothetical protein